MNTIQKLITEKRGLPESTAWYLKVCRCLVLLRGLGLVWL